MAWHRIHQESLLPIPLEAAWDFFTNPNNLQKLTPEGLNFKHVYPPDSDRVYPGMYLIYKVSPIAGIPLTWVTEITEVRPMERFVDDQITGPFGAWHHIHEFEARGNQTLARDLLYYRMPFGVLGSIAHGLFAKRQIKDIFRYREANLKVLFPA